MGGITMRGMALTLALLLGSTSAFAQTMPAPNPEELPPEEANAESAEDKPGPAAVGLEDIVVTAEKRAAGESVQRVPVAITAVSGEALKEAHISDLQEVGKLVPGAQLNDPAVPGFSNFFIRGVGLNGSVRTIDPAVSVVVDGLPHEFQLGTVLDVDDAQTIEVLRGPQGILFGRNATGGAISLTTRRPKNELEIEGKVRAGSNGRLDFYGLVAGPLIPDIVLGKLSISRRKFNGTFQDRNGGSFAVAPRNPSGTDSSTQTRQIGEDSWALRPTLVLKPTDALTINLLGEYMEEKGGAAAALVLNDVPNLQSLWGYTPPEDDDEINHNIQGFHKLKNKRAVADIRLNTGVGVITSITGYRDVDYSIQADIDGTPFTLFHFPEGNFDDSQQLSQELRFASDFSDVVGFVIGAYYSDLSISGEERRTLQLGAMPSALSFRSRWNQDSTSRAVFYNIDFRPIPEVRLSHGGRYTKDKKNFDVVPLSICAGPNFTLCPDTATSFKRSWDNFSPRFAAEWQASRRTLLYGSWTKGYRSGSFNSRANNIPAVGPADPETIQQFEAGIKATLLDGRARFNIAAFTSKYNDIQRTVVVNAVQTLANAASARLRGVEIESTFRPIDALVINGSLGYIDAKYNEFFGLDVNGGGYDPNVDPELAAKLDLDRVPRLTAYLGATYSFQLPGFAPELQLRGSYSYRSHVFGDVGNEVREPALNIFDAGFAVKSDRWTASVYGKNLTNEIQYGQSSRFNFGPGPGGIAYVGWGINAREYGLELAVDF